MSKEQGPIEKGVRALVENYSPLPLAVRDAALADCEARRRDAVAGICILKDAPVKVDEAKP
jgi:hypothetical protein